MFSANENILLRQHKRRVVDYVESTIPESALDMGTSVMVMEVKCRTPGCVPIETAIAIVFPRMCETELIPGVKESGIGSTYKAKILMPLASVTKDDVLDALPPAFEGGKKTWEGVCLNARDFLLGRIGGVVGIGDSEDLVEERRILAEYLKQCLEDYVETGCVAPELGKPFPDKVGKNEVSVPEELDALEYNIDQGSAVKPEGADVVKTSGVDVLQGSIEGNGNFVIRRTLEDDSIKSSLTKLQSTESAAPFESKPIEITTSRRRQQLMERSLLLPTSSDAMIQRLADREHAPGVRSPGCPCCDPDNMQNVVDDIMLNI